MKKAIESMTDVEIQWILQEMENLSLKQKVEKMRRFAMQYRLRENSVRNSRRSGTRKAGY